MKPSTFDNQQFVEEAFTKAITNYVSAAELYDMNVTEIPMLWDSYLPKIGLTCLAGPSDAGKSTLAKQLAYSIANGSTDLFGQPLNATKKKVLYIVTEDHKESVALIVRKQFEQKLPNLNNVHFIFKDDWVSLPAILDEQLSIFDYDLVIIDVWMDVFLERSSNNLLDTRKDLEQYSSLANKFHCAVLIVHHLSKSGSERDPNKNCINGSQGIEARCRSVLDLRPVKEQYHLTITKGNYCDNKKKLKSLILELNADTRRFSSTGEYKDACALIGGKTKYSNYGMIEKFFDLRKKGLSVVKARQEIVTIFGEDKVPSITQLKNIEKSRDRRK
jgi:RecA-family ATPase